ncbi:unnamed protein product [Vitrella brassicaformis CCMP3155]|uniref:DUF924 domain-containing protein n=1 Tax=Vitrella brassicaformis (strain CCMP3155) TaxID=1169540 RepID=A0A0G4FWM7_VITBC|nr:unnamed protein product [Vitrella brassicaformis CCMP3155]|mmetsp:Transcript_38501/g.96444  ORF Transcript_38501/g.96444 Transcript_38501/m.96444 type:complete len:232 (-) Transcript_38501:325-1020(-)|eukprot:CEM19256.1 unnamed protein product [Vitrella brassicaformis CCMP3155]
MALPPSLSPSSILHFWFGSMCDTELRDPSHCGVLTTRGCCSWGFNPLPSFEKALQESAHLITAVSNGVGGDEWTSAFGLLAQVIVLDQFTRSIHRGTREAFQHDERAVELSRQMVDSGLLHQLKGWQKQFAVMPLMHSECLDDQDLLVSLLTEWSKSEPLFRRQIDFAKAHRDVVGRFGRRPQRNFALNRESTAEELAWFVSDEMPQWCVTQIPKQTLERLKADKDKGMLK